MTHARNAMRLKNGARLTNMLAEMGLVSDAG